LQNSRGIPVFWSEELISSGVTVLDGLSDTLHRLSPVSPIPDPDLRDMTVVPVNSEGVIIKNNK